MATVYLALGSNIGDREKNLREAIRLLREAGLEITKISSFYETEPVDYLDQPWFLNGALEAQTEFSPTQLLTRLGAVESQMGSKKAFAKGPRLIDLDILLYGEATIKTPELRVPTRACSNAISFLFLSRKLRPQSAIRVGLLRSRNCLRILRTPARFANSSRKILRPDKLRQAERGAPKIQDNG